MADKSRAEYFRERRKTMKSFNVMLKREKVEPWRPNLKPKAEQRQSGWTKRWMKSSANRKDAHRP